MRRSLFASILLSMLACDFSGAAEGTVVFSGEKKLNNLVSELLEAASISKPGHLINPTRKTKEEANKFMGQVVIDGVEIDKDRTFREMYASSPEPDIPVWITYHWTIFRARGPAAHLTVSDWAGDEDRAGTFGQEQTFNFLELQPYRE